jgi:hypothetical protein
MKLNKEQKVLQEAIDILKKRLKEGRVAFGRVKNVEDTIAHLFFTLHEKFKKV